MYYINLICSTFTNIYKLHKVNKNMFGKKTHQGKSLDKEERFKKVASRRVKEILNKMRLLKNCANRNNYSYTDDQADKIVSAIENEWKRVRAEFKNSKRRKEEFSL